MDLLSEDDNLSKPTFPVKQLVEKLAIQGDSSKKFGDSFDSLEDFFVTATEDKSGKKIIILELLI